MPEKRKRGSKMRELAYKECSNQCPEFEFDCSTSAELSPLDRIIGQDRAVRAMQYGLRMQDGGFNVFISGESGTGRRTSVIDFIHELSKDRPVPLDYCYVNNFQDTSRPKCLGLPPGTGKDLRREMDLFASGLVKALQSAFESDTYNKKRETVIKSVESERNDVLFEANKMAQEAGFQLQPTPQGLSVIPMTEGRVLSPEELASLPPVLQKEIEMKKLEVEGKIRSYLRPLRDLSHKAEDLFVKLNRETADLAMDPLLEKARELFKGNQAVEQYLKDVEEDVLSNLAILLIPPADGGPDGHAGPRPHQGLQGQPHRGQHRPEGGADGDRRQPHPQPPVRLY